MEFAQPAIASRQDQIDAIIMRLIRGEDHLSFTSLNAFRRSPVSFIDYKLGKLEETQEETDAMKFGAMIHTLVLEPHLFDERYFTFDDSDKCEELRVGGAKSPRATKAYKEWYSVQASSAGDRMIVKPQEAAHARLVANNVKYNRAARRVMDLCPKHEVPIEWTFQNFTFKGYIDGCGEHAIFDLKSMADAEKRKAQRAVTDKGMYIQAAMYQHGMGIGKPLPHYIIAVDKMSGVSVHELHPRLLQQGMEDYMQLVDLFNVCIINDDFERSFDFYAEYREERRTGIFSAELPGYMLW
jgi:hypothetical protein